MPNQEPQYLDNRTTAGCGQTLCQMSGHQICSTKCVRQCRRQIETKHVPGCPWMSLDVPSIVTHLSVVFEFKQLWFVTRRAVWKLCSSNCLCILLALSSSELFGCVRTLLPSLLHIAQVFKPLCATQLENQICSAAPLGQKRALENFAFVLLVCHRWTCLFCTAHLLIFIFAPLERVHDGAA